MGENPDSQLSKREIISFVCLKNKKHQIQVIVLKEDLEIVDLVQGFATFLYY
jgi:hypothetical protein